MYFRTCSGTNVTGLCPFCNAVLISVADALTCTSRARQVRPYGDDLILSGSANRFENSSAMAFGINVNELERPGRADTAICVNVKSCRQLCQVSSLNSCPLP